jgi:histidinol-phosphate aminotransferase
MRTLVSLASGEIARYPDDGCTALRTALGERLHLSPHRILVGNGSIEILWFLALAYLAPNDRALVIGPTFGEYTRSAQIVGARVSEYRAPEAERFQPDLDTIAGTIREKRPRIVFLCNPNNPTGVLLDRQAITYLLDRLNDALLVIDEAYVAFTDRPHVMELQQDERLVLLRSMTKDYGLAGVRLGYAIGSTRPVEALERVRPPWNVNAVAQAVGLAAMRDDDHVRRGQEEIRKSRVYLMRELAACGLTVYPSAASFLLVRVAGTGPTEGPSYRVSSAVRSALLRHGICVRDCASFGLPGHIRIGLRTLPDCERLVTAVREVLGGGEL